MTKEVKSCAIVGVTSAPGPSPTLAVVLDLEQRTVDADEGLAEIAVLAGVGS
jgi:hypothetical protein